MTPKRINLYLTVLFVAAIGLSVFILRYASNWLTTSSRELVTLRSELAELDGKQADLEGAKKALSDHANDNATLARVLPEDKDQARVVQELYAIADQANVKIDSVGFPSSTLGTTTTAPKPATTDTTTTTNSTPSPSTNPSTDTAKPTKSVSQATPLKDIPGVQSIELSIGTITSKDASIKGIRYTEMTRLIRLIERNRRTMQIRSIGIGQTASASGEPAYNLTLSIVIFIKP